MVYVADCDKTEKHKRITVHIYSVYSTVQSSEIKLQLNIVGHMAYEKVQIPAVFTVSEKNHMAMVSSIRHCVKITFIFLCYHINYNTVLFEN